MVTLEVLVNLKDFKSRPGSGSWRELAFEPKASAPEPSPPSCPNLGQPCLKIPARGIIKFLASLGIGRRVPT